MSHRADVRGVGWRFERAELFDVGAGDEVVFLRRRDHGSRQLAIDIDGLEDLVELADHRRAEGVHWRVRNVDPGDQYRAPLFGADAAAARRQVGLAHDALSITMA